MSKQALDLPHACPATSFKMFSILLLRGITLFKSSEGIMNQQLAEFVVGVLVRLLVEGGYCFLYSIPQIRNVGVGRAGGGGGTKNLAHIKGSLKSHRNLNTVGAAGSEAKTTQRVGLKDTTDETDFYGYGPLSGSAIWQCIRAFSKTRMDSELVTPCAGRGGGRIPTVRWG